MYPSALRCSSLLVVTGARALGDTPESEAWAKALLATQMALLPQGAAVLQGGAVGPDTFARLAAQAIGLPTCSMTPSGQLFEDRDGQTYVSRWSAHDVHPLAGNRAMVDWAARHLEIGIPVSVIGLHAPWSRTQGTAHTLRHAREAGLEVASFSYPPA